ncbi:MAG: hypothetical protein ACP5FZ_00775 [Fidelibacterota bacterium]
MKPVYAIQKGKGRLLFPFCFTALFIQITTARWQDSFTRLALLDDFNGILHRQIASITKEFNITYRYDDIYRKRIFDQRVLTTDQQSGCFRFVLPVRTAAADHIFRVHIGLDRLAAENQRDRTAVRGEGNGKGQTYAILWVRAANNKSLGLQFRSTSRSHSATAVIKTYPHSEDSRLNRYFLDWLPRTFGNPIQSKIRTQQFELTPWISIPLRNDQNRLCIALNHFQWDNAVTFRYNNTTNKPVLNGRRILDIPTRFHSTQLSLKLGQSEPACLAAEIRYSHAGLHYHTDNHPPSFTDFDELGSGDFSLNSGALLCHHTGADHHFRAGVSLSAFGGDFSLRTPVLGVLYGILPISHKAGGELRKGRIFSQDVLYFYRLSKSKIRFTLLGHYLHSRIFLQMVGEAELEFGLVATPLDYPLRLDANIFDIQSALQYNFGDYALEYRLSQLLPVIRRLDESPVHFTEPVPGKKTVERGGTSHQLSLSRYF